jgi:hypothetical protein
MVTKDREQYQMHWLSSAAAAAAAAAAATLDTLLHMVFCNVCDIFCLS